MLIMCVTKVCPLPMKMLDDDIFKNSEKCEKCIATKEIYF